MLNKFLKFIILFIFPISLFAQYPDSGNKLRLGFQTTADGLIWRDSSNTARYPTPTSNKNTYVVLDTLTNKIYHYKNSTWTLVGGDTTSLSNRIDALGEYVDSIAVNFQDSIDAIQNGYFKQEFPTVTSDTLLWTKNVQLPLYSDDLLVFRNGQFLNNTQYTRIDTNKIKIAATSYKIGNNYTIVYLRGGGAGNGNQFDSTILNLQPRLDLKLNISDTASMLTNYYRSGRTGIIQASDVPTLNQNTTGSAATLTTSRTFQTNLESTSTTSFNGSANVTPGVTGTLPIANGGTGLTTFTASNRIPYTSSATALTTSSNLTYNNSTLTIGNENTNYDNLALKNKATTLNTTRRVGMAANTYEGDSLVGIFLLYADATTRSIIFGGGVSNLKNATDINFYTSKNVENPNDRGARLRMYIDSIGNIGMGTGSPSSFSSPANKLVVGTTSGNNGITIAAGTTGYSSIYFADGITGNEAYRGYIEYGHSADVLNFGTAASTRLTIASTGAATFSSSVSANSLSLTTPLSVANGGTGATTATAALNALLPTQSQSTTIGATLKSNGTNSYWDNFAADGTVQDQSGNFYNTVAIGTQVWFKENLRTKKYRSGALIPVKTNTDTSTLVGQMYYYANDSLTNYSIYGALYNWMATQSSDSLCPVGYHVSTDTDWTTLYTFLGGSSVAGGKLKSTTLKYWLSPNTGATNESGFTGLPGGYRDPSGIFSNITNYALFWTSSISGSNGIAKDLNVPNAASNNNIINKSYAASIRCVKN